jgi:hypothetical protein
VACAARDTAFQIPTRGVPSKNEPVAKVGILEVTFADEPSLNFVLAFLASLGLGVKIIVRATPVHQLIDQPSTWPITPNEQTARA